MHVMHILTLLSSKFILVLSLKKMMRFGGKRESERDLNWKVKSSNLVIDSIRSGSMQEHFPDVFDFTEKHTEKDTDQIPHKRPRHKPDQPTTPRKDYWDSTWGRMLIRDKDRLLTQPQSKEAKLFRRRFRLPPKLFFEVFVKQIEEIFDHDVGNQYRFRVPAPIKALIVLRILGRDAKCDDCVEFSMVAESSCNRIFHIFLEKYSANNYNKYVYFPDPTTEAGRAELAQIMESYRLLSFTGCVGSLDATHVKWEKCDKEWKWRCNGKEGYPTVAFQCVVSHTRRVYHVSKAFCGAENDLTTIRKCDEIRDALFNKYKDVEFVLYDAAGNPFVVKGAYFLSDNGYPDWRSLIRPINEPQSNSEVYFAEFAESVRKDIECFFGITKARWRFLKNAIQYHSPTAISNAFR